MINYLLISVHLFPSIIVGKVADQGQRGPEATYSVYIKEICNITVRVKGDVDCHVITVFHNHYLNEHPAVFHMRQNSQKCFVFRVPSNTKEL